MQGPPWGTSRSIPRHAVNILTKIWPAAAPDLDVRRPQPQGKAVSRPDGRSGRGRKAAGEESPGSTDERCRITSGGGNPRESATEKETAGLRPARVKRCGKSAPRGRQRQRHGKPHREQNRIGAARGSATAEHPRSVRTSRPGRLLDAPGNRRRRGMAVTHGATRALQNPAYRSADVVEGRP